MSGAGLGSAVGPAAPAADDAGVAGPPAAPHGTEDYAVVIGIWAYPRLKDASLEGPVQDVSDFVHWLTAPEGGNVPDNPARIIKILTAEGPVEPRPASEEIEGAFRRLRQLSTDRRDAGKGPRLGRRLYVYFAGHGCMLNDETALLTARAEDEDPDHVAARLFGRHFIRAGVFDQIVLFKDCCRRPVFKVTLREPTYAALPAQPGEDARTFMGFAAQPRKVAREYPIGGKVRGAFTTALLAGLRGGRREADGSITTNSLADYVYNVLGVDPDGQPVPPNDRPQFKHVSQQPFVLVPAPPAASPPRVAVVKVTFRARAGDKEIRVIGGAAGKLEPVVVPLTETNEETRGAAAFAPGFYVASLGAPREYGFSVTGIGDPDVDVRG